MIIQKIIKKQGKKIKKFLSMGMVVVLVLSPMASETSYAKTAVPTLTKTVSVTKGKKKLNCPKE